jgi:stage III sporulation protein AB
MPGIDPGTARIVAAGVVVWIGYDLGQSLARPWLERPRALRAWQVVLHRLSAETGSGGRDLARALLYATERLEDPVVGRAVKAFAARAREERRPTAELWEDMIAEAPWLSSEDRRCLKELAPVLGRYGRDDHVRHLERVREQLRRLEEEARRSRDREGRTVRTLVLLAGLALAVLVV